MTRRVISGDANKEDEAVMGTQIDTTTVKVLLGLALFFAGLVGLVVVVGLVQGTLNPTGVASILGGVFTGIVTTVLALLKKGGGGGDDKPPEK